MADSDTTSKFSEALNESSDAIIDALRASNDRGHRFTTALIEEVQEGQREAVDLAQKWAASPFDVIGFYGSLVESTTKAQGRALDATRQWFGELADAQKETRQTLQRIVAANRTATEASADLARGVVSRATEIVTSTPEVTNGRKTARQGAKSSGRAEDN